MSNQVREDPAGSGRVVVLGRAAHLDPGQGAHLDPEQGTQGRQGGEQFGEWSTPPRGVVRVRSS